MKHLTILSIFLCSLLLSCSSDDDNDTRYDWEITTKTIAYNIDGSVAYPNEEPAITLQDTLYDMTAKEVDQYIEDKYGSSYWEQERNELIYKTWLTKTRLN